MQKQRPDAVEVTWRFFSLRQTNHPDRDSWHIWEQPDTDPTWRDRGYAPSLRAFWAAEAARAQGEAAFLRFHRTLLQAVHQQGRRLDDPGLLDQVARAAVLDLAKFQTAQVDPRHLSRLAEDHHQAVALRVFGTPTFVFPGSRPAYLKLERLLVGKEVSEFWDAFHDNAVNRPYVLEFKRPH